MTNYSDNKYFELFETQKANQYHIGNTTYKARIKKLKALKFALERTYKNAIEEALYQDFKKPKVETGLTEIYLVVKEIKYAISNLRSWLSDQRVSTPLTLLGTSSYIRYEPKGVCLIISPWNYPVNLTFGPLVSAIAAGNTVILKPSEMTPNTSAVMAKIVKDVFSENEVALVEGEVEVSQELLKLPFNHIFFTGSPTVGKIIMSAASKHLSSVTLELGGKSPTIIHESVDLKAAMKNIVWGKYLNNGQTCIAPDYVFVHESIKDEFIEAFKAKALEYYSEDPKTSESYSRVVNEKHFNRLVASIENAKEQKATIELGGDYDEASNYIAPTLISNLPEEATLLAEEIFGPILPIKTYKAIDEVIDYINSKEKPLALYIYARRKRVINRILKSTRAGSTCINSNALQYSNHHLPFGGSNNSGIGKAHGFFGFQEFTNARSVLKRHFPGPLYLLFPPYNRFKEKITKAAIKWF
ncbi:aldehyde dehydrogenase family protein [Psychroserpens luteolus]|uniref:aldehyde dehydrogenase family protein n=1 Tax=Psychroserpens luteolus TaxID=2855840 RepID=UPI001E47F539|nr:aldehyde dehydrogenase family protein [Psychroserpens luteolus]MCD2258614.1 aldehyde dehydrogenase family protein [Psychroserpens luteolus]